MRIAMTVGELGIKPGILSTVIWQSNKDGQELVYLDDSKGKINCDLTIGVNISEATILKSNEGLSNRGVQLKTYS